MRTVGSDGKYTNVNGPINNLFLRVQVYFTALNVYTIISVCIPVHTC